MRRLLARLAPTLPVDMFTAADVASILAQVGPARRWRREALGDLAARAHIESMLMLAARGGGSLS